MSELIIGDDLIEYAKTISSKKEFEFFLECLIFDYQINKDEWQNPDLSSYLDGLKEFVPAMSSHYRNVQEEIDTENITWRILADMLLAASVYGS